MTMDEIKKELQKRKIQMLQLDPFGYCNARCWFCPVKYTPNPPEGRTHMPPELLTKILDDLMEERNKPEGLVKEDFWFLYTAHYNEVLLYKHFGVLLENLRKHGLKTMVLSNGTPLTPEKTDLIREYQDVVIGICLNIPAFQADIWEKRTSFKKEKFENLIENVSYAYTQLNQMVQAKTFSIQVNGIHQNSFKDAGGWVQPGENLPSDIDLDPAQGELATQIKIAQELFPGMHIFEMSSLVDRSGFLAEQKVIENSSAIEKYFQPEHKKVTGCSNGQDTGGRLFGWLHVNANGDAFLCCNDYAFEHKFGNFKTQTLREIWRSDRHAEVIVHSLDTLCRKCVYATWEDVSPKNGS
ncbi:MAG: radical SAM protein [bacterium]